MEKRWRNVRGLFIAAAAMVAAVFVFSGCQKPEARETFRIGMVADLTGNYGFIGEGMKNAMLLAKDKLKGNKYRYELLFEDDQADPKLSASAANKLINVDRVDAIVSIEASAGHIISALATKNNIIHFGITTVKSVAEGDNNFIHWTPPAEQARVLAGEFQKRNIRRVAIFKSRALEDWTMYVQELRRIIKDTDITIVAEQAFQAGKKDFRSMIAEARRKKPDIYVLLCSTPALEILAKQIKEAGIKTPLTSIEAFEGTQDAQLFEGYWYVSSAEPTAGFVNAYKQKYGRTPPLCAGNAYDIFNLIVTAVERAGVSPSTKPAAGEIIAELKKIKDFKGALGVLYVDDSGIVHSEAKLKMVKNGRFIEIGG
ncbi:MAG: ABC transporter substrate-binding protein [Deferribacteres bacterium]|nr:ABC transporter substrate-binding protein [Deferribacteres bacterium]